MNRVAVLIGTGGETRRAIEKASGAALDVNSQSGAAIPQVTYRISSAFSVNFGVAFFWGAVKYTDMPLANLTLGNRGGGRPYENGTYNGIGIVRERDEIFFSLRYTF